jgi:hypothetical protein
VALATGEAAGEAETGAIFFNDSALLDRRKWRRAAKELCQDDPAPAPLDVLAVDAGVLGLETTVVVVVVVLVNVVVLEGEEENVDLLPLDAQEGFVVSVFVTVVVVFGEELPNKPGDRTPAEGEPLELFEDD